MTETKEQLGMYQKKNYYFALEVPDNPKLYRCSETIINIRRSRKYGMYVYIPKFRFNFLTAEELKTIANKLDELNSKSYSIKEKPKGKLHKTA